MRPSKQIVDAKSKSNGWTLEETPTQSGKVAIVTGANSGIGFHTSTALAEKGATVIMACRDMKKGEKAQQEILSKYPAAHLKVMKLDVSSMSDVRQFAQHFLAHFDRLDFLINNAGIMMSPYHETADGFENQLATNYLGHFKLTGTLMNALRKTGGSRVVTLSSLSYKWADIQFEDLHFKNGYDKRKAYGQSKRACLVFAYELQRRLEIMDYPVKSIAAHPGLSNTNLDRYFPKLIRPLGGLFLQRPDKGALPVLFAALNLDLKGGEYIGPDGFQEMRGNPTEVNSDDKTKDSEIASRLWKESMIMTGEQYLDLD